MAYTIIRSDGNVLATIQDGTINTTATSLGLPGRNYASYGQTLDTNLVRMLENFAKDTVPANPIRGQLWYNTNDSTLRICPADNTTTASNWVTLTTTSSAGDTTLGNVTVTGDIDANNIAVTSGITANTIDVNYANIAANLVALQANITTANLTTVRTQTITTGAATTAGTLTGIWTISGNTSGNGLVLGQGNIAFSSATYGIKSDNYMYGNGSPFNPAGTYGNSNVALYLNNAAGYTGNLYPSNLITGYIGGGGTIANVWTLASGARIQATYADLAERYEADAVYPVGTVVEIGGEKEINSVKDDSSEEVFGVISNSAAYLMNSTAGDDDTHPAVALAGRVHVLVVGKVKKGQRLVSAGNGKARAGSKEELTSFNTIGRALANKDDDGEGMLEAVVFVN